jgi:hypothetical protein
MNVREMWERITVPRHTRALEASAHMELELRAEVARQCAEINRLRAENRALLNSILGIAGIPPLPVDRDTFVAPQLYPERAAQTESVGAQHAAPAAASSLLEQEHRVSNDVISSDGTGSPSSFDGRSMLRPYENNPAPRAGATSSATIAVPMRRRSWQQINRMLEFDSARKKEPEMSS